MTLRTMFVAAMVVCMMSAVAFAASIDGKWTGEMQTQNGTRPVTFTFTSDGSTLNGTTTGRGGDVKITNGKIDGDKVTFDVVREMQGNTMTTNYTGKVSGSELKLTVKMGDREPRDMTLKKAE
jgi:opacity protein-like surface antigen